MATANEDVQSESKHEIHAADQKPLSKDDEGDVYQVTLELLREEASDEEYQAAIQTLYKIFRNIGDHPGEEKYRQLRTENKIFVSRVWHFSGAQEFLLAAGWVQVDDKIILPSDAVVQAPLSVLGNINSTFSPSTSTSTSATTNPKESEKERLIAEQRQKQLEKLKKEREERKRIQQQIQADRAETKGREVKDSRARDMKFGGKMTKFEDIGVNLNKGG